MAAGRRASAAAVRGVLAGDGDDLGGPRLEVGRRTGGDAGHQGGADAAGHRARHLFEDAAMGVGRIWFHSSLPGAAAGQSQGLGPEPGRLFARLAQVPSGVGDAFEHGPDEVAWRCVRRHAEEDGAGVGVPQRGPLAGEVGQETSGWGSTASAAARASSMSCRAPRRSSAARRRRPACPGVQVPSATGGNEMTPRPIRVRADIRPTISDVPEISAP